MDNNNNIEIKKLTDSLILKINQNILDKLNFYHKENQVIYIKELTRLMSLIDYSEIELQKKKTIKFLINEFIDHDIKMNSTSFTFDNYILETGINKILTDNILHLDNLFSEKNNKKIDLLSKIELIIKND